MQRGTMHDMAADYPRDSARPQPYPEAINFLTGAIQERETPHPPTTRARRDTHWLATEPSLGNLGAHQEPHQRPRRDATTCPYLVTGYRQSPLVRCKHPNPPPYSSPAARPAGQPHACNGRPYRTSGGHASVQRDTNVQTRSVLNHDPDPCPRSRCPCQVPRHPGEHAGWA